ncbi:MAG: hypothetical protein H6742_03515 [Alphaproteobacteria bacterium]|nr:hypothetical protein [Alphaproteobacteria bacterium]
MSDPTAPARYLLALLLDVERRAEHARGPDAACAAFGLTPTQAASFRDLSMAAVAADADARVRYLMSALCRAYPLSSGAIGAAPGGRDRLVAVLAAPDAIAGPARRNALFGRHLARLLELDPMQAGRGVTAFLAPFVEVERALVESSARLREAVTAGHAPPAPRRPSKKERRTGRLVLPPSLVAARLPASPEVLRAALMGITPENAWQRIEAPGDAWERVVAVARAADGPAGSTPVILLARGVVHGVASARGGAGGVAPLVDVRHRTVELSADVGGLLRQCDGSMGLDDLPPRQARLADALLDAGFIEVVPG